jgi:hypothetical protein
MIIKNDAILWTATRLSMMAVSLEKNPVPRDIKMSSFLCYGRIQNCKNHVTVFFHNTRKRTF